MNAQQESRWLTLLVDLWRHTPLSIMMDALTRSPMGPRARQSNQGRSNPIAPETPVSAQMK
jgi:hypothetical protein